MGEDRRSNFAGGSTDDPTPIPVAETSSADRIAEAKRKGAERAAQRGSDAEETVLGEERDPTNQSD